MRNYVINIVSIFFCLLFIYGCNYYKDVHLGQGYYLWVDGKYREIVYKPIDSDNIHSVMHKNVLMYSVIDSAIFVKVNSSNYQEGIGSEFYIIRKKQLNLEAYNNQKQVDSLFNTIIVPISDSLVFNRILIENGLRLKK